MTVERLKPFPGQPVHTPKTPPCEAEVQVIGWHAENWRLNRGQKPPFTCSRPSVVKIGKRHYCRLHGGHVALDMYLEGRLVEK